MREYLKRLREEKGYSMHEMARKLEISPQYYWLIEAGKRQQKMDIVLISKISSVLNVPLAKIIENEKALSIRKENANE